MKKIIPSLLLTIALAFALPADAQFVQGGGGGSGGSGCASTCLLAANNLSDVVSAPTALTNIGAAPAGTGSVVTGSQTPSAADFAVCKSFVLNGNSLDLKVPVSTTLQASGGCYWITAMGTSDTITVTSPDTVAYGSTTSGAGGSQALTQGGSYLVLTDGNGHVYSNTAGGSTFTGGNVANATTFQANGALSASAVNLTGTIVTGGTGTTAFPLFYINTTGATAVAGFSTSGTMFGANVVACGNFFDLYVSSSERWVVDCSGNMIAATIQAGGGNNIDWLGRSIMSSTADGLWQVTTNAGTRGMICDVRGIPVVTGTGSPTILAGSSNCEGEVTGGATATSIVITFSNSGYSQQPICTVTDESTLVSFTYTISSTAITITQTATTGNKVDYICHGRI